MLVLRLALRALVWRTAASVTVFAVALVGILAAAVGPIYLHAVDQAVLTQRLLEAPQITRDIRVNQTTLIGTDADWHSTVRSVADRGGRQALVRRAGVLRRGAGLLRRLHPQRHPARGHRRPVPARARGRRSLPARRCPERDRDQRADGEQPAPRGGRGHQPAPDREREARAVANRRGRRTDRRAGLVLGTVGPVQRHSEDLRQPAAPDRLAVRQPRRAGLPDEHGRPDRVGRRPPQAVGGTPGRSAGAACARPPGHRRSRVLAEEVADRHRRRQPARPPCSTACAPRCR